MSLIDFLAPRSCVFCGVPCERQERSICVGCYDDLPWHVPAVSPAPDPFHCAIAMLDYSFPVDAALKALKFNRKLFYAPAFGELLCAAIPLLPEEIDAVLPVPLHWRRKTKRGFNQADEIARPLVKKLGLPVVRDVYRNKATPFQSGLKASARTANMKNAFSVRRPPGFEHVLIVDDVTTTGATLEQIRKLLRKHKVRKVSSLVVATA